MVTRRKHRVWIWVLSIVAVLLVLTAGAAWYLSQRWRPLLDSQLKQLVLTSTDSLYHLEYEEFDLNLVNGNASLKNARLYPDSAVYEKMVREQTAPDNLYELKVNSIILSNFHPKLLYEQKKLNIDQIIIDNPALVLINKRLPFNDTVEVEKKKPRTVYEMISGTFKEVRVGSINLKNINFTFINKSNSPVKTTAIKNLNININDILVDSLSEQDRTRLYHTRNVDVLMADYRIATADSLYYLKFKDIAFSTSGRSLKLGKLSLEPRYAIPAFYRKVGQKKDRFNIAFNKIEIKGMDLRRFSREQKLYAGSLNLQSALVEVYNTNAWPKGKSEVKIGKFPHQQLQKLALDLKIDTVILRNTLISYSEYNKVARQTGIITFNRTSGRIFNLTNDPAALAKNHTMRAYLSSRLMNTGRLDIRFTFNLTDTRGAFTYAGTLGAMDGRVLNKITRPLGMVEINNVKIQKMTFDARANEISTSGTMRFFYNGLNVRVLARDKETGEVKKQGLVSQVANTFILHEDNPNRKGKFTTGTIYYKRELSASFFTVIWKGLFSGVKESVGVSAEREAKLKNTVTKVGNFIGGIKEKIEERKERRAEKKEEKAREKAEKAKQKELKKKD